jgi:magnesium-transporting ATPase (P-type)
MEQKQKYFWNKPNFLTTILSSIILLVTILTTFGYLLSHSINWFSTGPSLQEKIFTWGVTIVTLIATLFNYFRYIKHYKSFNLILLILIFAIIFSINYIQRFWF